MYLLVLYLSTLLCLFVGVNLLELLDLKKSKSNLYYTRRITPKRVTSGGAHLRGLAPGFRSSEETWQR